MKTLIQRWLHHLRVPNSTPPLLASSETVTMSQSDPPVLSILFNTLWGNSLEPEADEAPVRS